MWQKDETLHELHKKAARKAYLHGVIADLRRQESELAGKVALLDSERKTEQDELDKLSGRSLSAFFYAVTGKKEEQLAKEKKEALAAQAKYDSAARELEAVREDITRYNGEYSALIGYDVRYEKLLDEKAEALKAAGKPQAERIIALEKTIAEFENAEEEINEAIAAANRAIRSADAVLQNLSNAENWASWDVFGGGMIADAAKHDKLDAAQDAVEVLQIDLRRLKTELSDIAEEMGIKVNIEGFLRFADWFFDGIFVDYSVLQRIEESKEKICEIKQRVKAVKKHLQNKLKALSSDSKRAEAELEKLVLEAEV